MPEDNFEEKIVRIIRKNYLVGNAREAAAEILTATDQEIENRLRRIGVGISNCKECSKEIIFIKTKMGNFMPVCLNLISHFADCPGAKQFRKKRSNNNKPLTNKFMDKDIIKTEIEKIETSVGIVKEELEKPEEGGSEA